MLKIMISLAALLVSINTFAASTVFEVVSKTQQLMISENIRAGLDWKVGDNASYNIDMGFLKGTMVTSVTSNDPVEGIWMTQDVELGFAGKQKIETLIDPNTGEVKKLLVNGQEQEAPKPNLELIEVIDDTITVPAGTFDCIHIRLNNKDDNTEIKVWSNSMVPMAGMVKQIAPSQFGEVTIELTAFEKL